jgi:hypothetical protein
MHTLQLLIPRRNHEAEAQLTALAIQSGSLGERRTVTSSVVRFDWQGASCSFGQARRSRAAGAASACIEYLRSLRHFGCSPGAKSLHV